MNPLRDDLIALARIMPEPALWTACEVLKAIKEAQAELDAAEASSDAPQQPPSNVLSFASYRNRRLEQEGGRGTVPQARARDGDLAQLQGRVADGLARISKMEEIIREARAKGRPTHVAEGLVDAFHRSVELMRVHAERMQRSAGDARASR